MRRLCLFRACIAAAAAAAFCLLDLSGCGCYHHDYPEYYSDPVEEEPPPASFNISVESIEIPEWPPLGFNDEIRIGVSADSLLDHVKVMFAQDVSLDASGYSDEVTVTGGELGEGYGTLSVTVYDSMGRWANRLAEHLLVDLSPPRVEIPATAIRGDEALEVWVRDAWVLGSVELQFEGATLVHTFPEVWPGTLGEQWDESIVYFGASDLPAATGGAELRVSDAAGNQTVEAFELVIDDKPPEVDIVEPAPDTEVRESFVVAVKASDNVTDAPAIELRAGGAPIATAMGPYAEITLDARDFAYGIIELAAVATDDVGNRSMTAPLTIVVK